MENNKAMNTQKVIPDNLYHYTTIDSLAYILDSKQFKFNRLDYLDDTTEGLTQDSENIRKYYYVSSWTSSKEENLALWSMYTNNMQGIRIEMESFPFLYHNGEKWISHKDYDYKYNPLGTKLLPFIDKPIEKWHIYNKQYLSIDPQLDFLISIKYTDNKSNLLPNCFSKGGTIVSSDIGKFKSKLWEFQNEWRYVLRYKHNSMFGFKGDHSSIKDFVKHQEKLEPEKKLVDSLIPDITFKYMKISDSALKNMKIRIGPKSKEADIIIVRSLLKSYGLEDYVEVKWSDLKGSIR